MRNRIRSFLAWIRDGKIRIRIRNTVFDKAWVFNCPGHEPNTDIGPVISQQSKERIHRLIQSAVDQGAELLLDGRNAKVRIYQKLLPMYGLRNRILSVRTRI